MRGAELDGDDLLLLLGQIGGDEILRPPHEERPDPSLKPLHPARILPGLDRSDVLLLEPVRGREQTRRRDREQRPHVAQRVLQRRSRQRQPERRVDRLRRLMDLRGPVLDELRLVEDEPRPWEPGDLGLVEAEDRVRDDDDIGPGDHLGEGGAPLLRRLTDDANVEVRRVLCGFLRPDRDHRGGGDDEERRLARPGRGIAIVG